MLVILSLIHYHASKSITGIYHYRAIIATGKQSTYNTCKLDTGDAKFILFSRDWFDVREEQQPSTGRGIFYFPRQQKLQKLELRLMRYLGGKNQKMSMTSCI